MRWRLSETRLNTGSVTREPAAVRVHHRDSRDGVVRGPDFGDELVKRSRIKRKVPLRVDPKAVRAWLDRSRAPLRRTTELKGGGTPLRGSRPSEPLILDPLENAKAAMLVWANENFRRAVWRLDDGSCVNCNAILDPYGTRWQWVAHHVVEKQHLPEELRGNPDSACLLCRLCHERHHSRTAPVRRERLPQRNLDFVARLGAWAEVRLERAHPLQRR